MKCWFYWNIHDVLSVEQQLDLILIGIHQLRPHLIWCVLLQIFV